MVPSPTSRRAGEACGLDHPFITSELTEPGLADTFVNGLAVVHPLPSVAAVASVVAVQGNLGIVTGLEWQGVVVDADHAGATVVGRTAPVRQRWHILAGLHASTLERRIFESREITAITADKALMLASLAGTPGSRRVGPRAGRRFGGYGEKWVKPLTVSSV